MKTNRRILAIIPARGGSKGIPRKNIRLLRGKPLIAYSIEVALKSKYIDRVIVSTEDEEIAEISRFYGAEVVKRPKKLAKDDVSLDPVVFHALTFLEKNEGVRYDDIITIQPTSPLLSVETLDKAIQVMLSKDYDTLISVKDETHLYWTKREGEFIPLYEERKNRQYLDPIYKEIGAILISKRDVITESNRIGSKITLFEVPREEGIDIDTNQDWLTAKNLLNKRKIVFRVDGDNEIGLGHVYRTVTLANQMAFNHNVFFLMSENKKMGIRKVEEHNYNVVTFKEEKELFKKLEEINPDIVINDILDTNENYILKLKNEGYFTINFEDLGKGSEFAHVVINALYESSSPPKNRYYGYRYVCLRDEFHVFPQKKIEREVKRILVTFGGTDPNNLTLRTLKAIERLSLKDIFTNVILGLGYELKEELYDYVNALRKKGFVVDIKENVKMIAKEILDADIAITSNGRTIYEIGTIGTPCISISQNEREARHLFVHNSRGIKYLGMAYSVSEEGIASAISELIENYELRIEMNKKLLKFDLKKGLDRVLRLIFDEYNKWVENA